MKKILAPLLLTLSSTMSVVAQSNVAGLHLNSSPDARSAAMGSTGVATSPDEFSQFWNPAKLVLIQNNYATSLSYTPPTHDGIGKGVYATGYKQIHSNLAVGIGINYLSDGRASLRDDIGNNTGSFSPSELGIDISVSKKFSTGFSMGTTVRYIKSDIFEYTYDGAIKSANTIAVDVGAFYKYMISANSINFGVVLANLGSKLNYGNGTQKFLPSSLRMGINYDTGGDNPFNIGLEINKLLVPNHSSAVTDVSALSGLISSFQTLDNFSLSLGGEYTFAGQFMLRSGLNFRNTEIGNLSFGTAGFGFIVNKLRLNMSYVVPISTKQFITSNRFKLSLGLMF